MLENLKNYKVILASNSPRRRELLSGLGIDYEVKVLPDISEVYPDSLRGEEIPMYIAREKAEAYRSVMRPDELIITADTIVYIGGEVLGKPVDEADAYRMLHVLSGRSHHVITGVCLTSQEKQKTFSSVTEVMFDTLSDEEIDFYVRTFKPFDKAGSYGVREWIGFIGVKGLKGSFYNIMGLPVQRLYQELKLW